MAALMDQSLILNKAVEKLAKLHNFSTKRLTVLKRTNQLKTGDFYIPKGCFTVDEDKVATTVAEMQDTLIKESESWPFKIRDVLPGTYDIFHIFLDRPSFFSTNIRSACSEETQFGKVATAHHDQSIFLDIACASELAGGREFTMDDLRALVLSQHIQLLLESQGHKVVNSHTSDMLLKCETAMKVLGLQYSETVQTKVTESEEAQYKRKIMCHCCCSNQSRTQTASSSSSFTKKGSVYEKSDMLQEPADKTETAADSECISCNFSLKKYIEHKRHTVGKNNFDKNLNICEVISQGEPSDIFKHVMKQDKVMQISDDVLCMHIVPQRQVFQFQKVHLLLEATSEHSGKLSQLHYIYGQVTHRRDDTVADAMKVDNYFRLRYKQMYEAAVMKYGAAVQGEGWEKTIEAVTSACIKFELLSSVARNNLKLDLSDTDGGAVSDSRSGSFVMYNCARLATLFSHFQKAVHTGLYPALPDIKDIDFSTLREEEEWSLMFNFVSVYPAIVRQAVEDVHPNNSFLSNLHTHKVCVFLSSLSRCLSSYYSRVHVLGENRGHLLPTMYARLYLLKSVHQVMVNGLALLGITALSQL